jgi:hypothetical protein
MGAYQAKLDADLRNPPSLGTPSIQSDHEYHSLFALDDGGRLAPMAADLVDRLAVMVSIRRFPSMGAAESRSLRCESYARMKEFVRRSAYIPFRLFLGDVRREFT